MNKLYNTQGKITSRIREFLTKVNNNCHCCYKPQLNFLPEVIYGIISSESIVAHNVSLELKDSIDL